MACFTSLARFFCILLVHVTAGQHHNDCPAAWFQYSGHCYNFVVSPTLTFQEATIYCQRHLSALVSINSPGEHEFVQSWLKSHDIRRLEWFTSGKREGAGSILWDSDGTQVVTRYFEDDAIDQGGFDPMAGLENNIIVYKYVAHTGSYLWAWSRLMRPGPFICELTGSETWRLDQQVRDFSYGTNITNPSLWEHGPNITSVSRDTLFYDTQDHTTGVTLECVATGNPRPTYTWLKQRPNQQSYDVIPASDSRYTLTSGRLSISRPSSTLDATWYTCVASNKFGTVMSSPIEVSHGYLGQFPNVKPSPVYATMYMGKEITCQPPLHNTDLRYNWYRGSFNFLRPELNPQYFLSQNGKLYISEVQPADQDEYYCMVFMAPRSGQVVSGTQLPSRTSMGIELRVQGESANTYGPDIQDKFPQYFPTVPMVGDTVEIECLAYGRLPLIYSWVREDGALHPGATTRDHNRVLVLPSARLQDTGAYTCVVRGAHNTANKTVYLSLKAVPYFPYPLQNQHVDAKSTLTWTCHAIGVPAPVYTWYKNGTPLKSSTTDGITVYRNTLTIESVEGSKHAGMYECEANNAYGRARSSAQLRALYFAPTFLNSPVERTKMAAEGGNISIACRPQAAPRAQITWLKNGAEVGVTLPNGDLHLSALTLADSGNYTCVASNELGQVTATCLLDVQEKSVFEDVPSDTEVEQNQTAVLPCRASFSRGDLDIAYTWTFYSHLIDLTQGGDDVTHFSMPYLASQGNGMLYIISAQFRHEGEYTCHVSTVTGTISSKAFLKVKGPPGEPGGVHVRDHNSSLTTYDNVNLWWQDGENHGYHVTKYSIEYLSVYETDWRLLKSDIPVDQTIIENYPDWRGDVITEGLSPGTAYQFRVAAGNDQVGYGPASNEPHVWYTMPSAAPVVAPSNIEGGGGSVGLLLITWDPLPRSQWGGENVRYVVYYRKQDEKNPNRKWEMSPEIFGENSFSALVGPDNYYLPYEVKVQAVNEMGVGPNSTISIVYSADEIPTNISPTFVSASAINSTAGVVEWVPVPDTREAAKGKVFGYQVNYWQEDTKCLGRYEGDANSNNFYGDVSSGMLVGLDFSGDYCVNIQFLNHAGMGPKTDNYYLGMNDAPPSQYPEWVTVMSHGNDSVRLMWRGISTLFGEDPLLGYKAWYWNIQEDIRSAKVETFPKITTGVIRGLEKDVIYRLRMLGYSNGGDGKKSQDVFFTLGGQVPYDPQTTEVMNFAPSLMTSSPGLLLLFLVVGVSVSEIHR